MSTSVSAEGRACSRCSRRIAEAEPHYVRVDVVYCRPCYEAHVPSWRHLDSERRCFPIESEAASEGTPVETATSVLARGSGVALAGGLSSVLGGVLALLLPYPIGPLLGWVLAIGVAVYLFAHHQHPESPQELRRLLAYAASILGVPATLIGLAFLAQSHVLLQLAGATSAPGVLLALGAFVLCRATRQDQALIRLRKE